MTLVVMGAKLAPDLVDALARACGAVAASMRGDHACRFEGGRSSPEFAALCGKAGLDWARAPLRPLADFGLFVADMDSTLINIECIDEVADMHGVKAEVSAITESAMKGEIDFAASLTRRVALLAGLPEGALAEVYNQRLKLNPGAEQLIAELKTAGVHTVLVSGGFTFFSDRLKARLGFDEAHANTLEVRDGRLTGRLQGAVIDAAAKAAVLREARGRLNLASEQTIAIGDGANDLLMLREAGLAVAYKPKSALRPVADVCLDHAGLDGLLNLFD